MTRGYGTGTTLRGGLAPDVRPGRCAYCGRPCNGRTCAAHADLPVTEAEAQAAALWDNWWRAVEEGVAAVDRSVETVDRPNGLRSESAT